MCVHVVPGCDTRASGDCNLGKTNEKRIHGEDHDDDDNHNGRDSDDCDDDDDDGGGGCDAAVAGVVHAIGRHIDRMID